LGPNVKTGLVAAAAEIGTCVLMPAAEITSEFDPFSNSIIPRLGASEIDSYQALLQKARLVSIEYSESVRRDLPGLMGKIKRLGRAVTMVRVPAETGVEEIVSALAHQGAEIIHIVADYRGRELNGAAGTDGRLLKDIIRAVHLRLVEDRIRDEITIIVSGGIGMAEHVPKAMLCGADLVAVDIPLMVALGARIYEEPDRLLIFPEGLAAIPPAIVTQRIVNLMGAWHSQILEMMGAMGIREARRLRGESGRAIFFEEIDRDTFGSLFGR
jgi:hypothetical protein